MDKKNFSKIAVTGLVSGALFLASCGKEESAAKIVKKAGYDLQNINAEFVDNPFSAVHECAGLNICKGLGGCNVTEEKLSKLAEKMGIPRSQAGEVHTCAGLNECKGLGGCAVTAEKFAELKAKVLAEK